MRSTMDLTPLYRASIGFDRIADLMDRALAADITTPTYPPYNIEKMGENAYRISIAVAGFAADDLSVEMKDGAVIVSARKVEEDESRTFLHRGIATRAFERKFALADHVRVTGATARQAWPGPRAPCGGTGWSAPGLGGTSVASGLKTSNTCGRGWSLVRKKTWRPGTLTISSSPMISVQNIRAASRSSA